MKKSKSIRWQITGAFLGFLVLALGLIIFLNMTFMEQYYLENKKEILKTSYETIAKEYDAVDKTDTLKFASTNNLSFVIIDWNGSEPEGYSNLRDSESKKLAAKLFGYIYNFEPKGDKIIEKTNNYTIQFNKDTSLNMEFLEIWGTLDDGVNFIVRSPIESIQKSIALSNRFYLMVALGVCVIGAAFIAFLAKRLTKPLTELTEISRRMANLDFDVKYTSGGEDEIGVLGHNFNQMSETLEQTISELKTANNELQKNIKKKEEIDEMRKEFLSNVSHELKTPIALIQGYAEGLQDNINDDEESRQFYCDVIIDEAGKMNQMVKKLLTLNQLEFGNDQVNMERFDLTSLIQGVIQSSQILAQQAEVEIMFHQTEPLHVWGDEFKVEEVITNYVTNAIHYAKNEKKIDIRCTQENGVIRTSVFNTGDAIPEEELDKIWIKFYKVDKARTREYGGSGIGLSIVKAIMESMNQQCGVKNYDNGVEFWFTLDTTLSGNQE